MIMGKPIYEDSDTGPLFVGFTDRGCGDHRTVGPHRAWCFDCGEWCYPSIPCVRCERGTDQKVAEDSQQLSKLLWDARELASMYADVVEAKTGKNDSFARQLVADIDVYRAGRGWSPDGFGGEDS